MLRLSCEDNSDMTAVLSFLDEAAWYCCKSLQTTLYVVGWRSLDFSLILWHGSGFPAGSMEKATLLNTSLCAASSLRALSLPSSSAEDIRPSIPAPVIDHSLTSALGPHGLGRFLGLEAVTKAWSLGETSWEIELLSWADIDKGSFWRRRVEGLANGQQLRIMRPGSNDLFCQMTLVCLLQ